MKNLKKPINGMYYTRFMEETIEQAVMNHEIGYMTIEEAIEDSFYEPDSFEIYDSNLKLIMKITGEDNANSLYC